MSAVLEPRAGGGDVVGGALALHLDEDGHVRQVLAVPLVERLQQLEAVGRGRHVHLHLWEILDFGFRQIPLEFSDSASNFSGPEAKTAINVVVNLFSLLSSQLLLQGVVLLFWFCSFICINNNKR